MKIFMLDNYDSFTYNLVQYFQILGCDVTARRCDCTTVDAVFALRPDAIVLSPGPGRPESAGILLELIREGLARQMPMARRLPRTSGHRRSAGWRRYSRSKSDARKNVAHPS